LSNLFFFVKTRSLNTDRRVQRELKSLYRSYENIDLVYASNDIYHKSEWSSKKIKLVGGAAPKNFFIRFFGAIQFCFLSFLYYRKRNVEGSLIWICDPVLFPLVLLLSYSGGKIVWDHHELPPSWLLHSKFFSAIFKKAYSRVFINIHCNNSRKDYLEKKLNFFHERALIMPNLPEQSELEAVKSINLPYNENGKAVFLQNSMIPQRCGYQILEALKISGYKALHAGSSATIDDKSVVYNLGSLSLEEISYCLDHSKFTIVTYKSNSLNQKYCEPNRLYHAMARGSAIIAGNNPTIIEILADYPNKVILADDGSNSNYIVDAIKEIEKMELKSFNYKDFWSSKFAEILSCIAPEKLGVK